jgi:hypothetical protein
MRRRQVDIVGSLGIDGGSFTPGTFSLTDQLKQLVA